MNIYVGKHLLFARFINNLFGKIFYTKTFFRSYLAWASIKPKQRTLSEKIVFENLIDIYNYIFLNVFQINTNSDIFQTRLIQITLF